MKFQDQPPPTRKRPPARKRPAPERDTTPLLDADVQRQVRSSGQWACVGEAVTASQVTATRRWCRVHHYELRQRTAWDARGNEVGFDVWVRFVGQPALPLELGRRGRREA